MAPSRLSGLTCLHVAPPGICNRMRGKREPDTDEMALLLVPGPRGGCPLENPAIDPIPGDPLCEPHPDEPGVEADGTAAPLENPGRGPRLL